MLFLKVSGKKFDSFHRKLYADEAGISSVRFLMVNDAPLLKVAQAVAPKSVRVETETAFQLVSENGVVNQFAHRLGELDFPPMRNRRKLAETKSVGQDVPAQVLLLVR